MERITPEKITKLNPNEIFVFGSNKQGHHAGGAAAYACVNFGAEWGNGYGLQGQSYAIPTLSFAGGTEDHRLPLNEITAYVEEFIKFAKQHPEYVFLVTPIGCGIAGFTAEQIAPMFKKALRVKNIYLPKLFIDILGQGALKKMVNESIKKALGELPIVTHENLLNIFTMPEEHRNHPLMEGYFASYSPEVVKKYLDKRYGDGAEVVVFDNENGEKVFRIRFADSDYNQNVIDKDMSLCGYFPSYVERKNGRRDIQYEPRHQNKVNKAVKSAGIVYHLTPTEKVEKILSMGLCPKNNDKMFMYPSRIYAFLSRPSSEDCECIIRQFYDIENRKYYTDKKLGKKAIPPHYDYTLLKISTNDLNINWYFDPNAENCVYTKENIPPQNIEVVGNIAPLMESVSNKLSEWIYCGVFLDDTERDILMRRIRATKVVNPKNWKLYCHHMTLAYNNGTEEAEQIFNFYQKILGKEITLQATEIGYSDKAVAIKILKPLDMPCVNAIKHITIAVSSIGKPVDSNKITKWKTLPMPITIHGRIGYFGKDKTIHYGN